MLVMLIGGGPELVESLWHLLRPRASTLPSCPNRIVPIWNGSKPRGLAAHKGETMLTLKQVLILKEEKKHSVRYDAAPGSVEPPVITAAYISKHFLTAPWPGSFTVTFEENEK